MSLDVIPTDDGSVTLLDNVLQVTYHSRFGARRESQHIFIQHGLLPVFAAFPHDPIQVFEMGFGTGLNAWLTLRAARAAQRYVNYTGLERHPVPESLFPALQMGYEADADYETLLTSAWHQQLQPDPLFSFCKLQGDIVSYSPAPPLHLVYYDAFAPQTVPQCWEAPVFERLFAAMLPGAVLVTFCAKGSVKRLLRQVGFEVESPVGPPGKREMTKALKP